MKKSTLFYALCGTFVCVSALFDGLPRVLFATAAVIWAITALLTSRRHRRES
jgi:hypothetical protein